MTEERHERYKREKDIAHLKAVIEAERQSGATDEDLRPLTDLLLTLTISGTSTAILEQAREKYIRECGDNEAVMRLFDIALSNRS